MGMFDKIFGKENVGSEISEDEYYSLGIDEAYKDSNSEGNKMILLEPRAYSESQQIADHLKKRNTVVVNLKRVTQEQAKFLKWNIICDWWRFTKTWTRNILMYTKEY